jgi:hypothetical protein
MPGVKVTTGAVAGPSSPNRAPSSTYFVVGLASRGPTDRAVMVSSLADFQQQFGVRPTYGNLYDDVRTFFEEGGTRCYVARAVGPAATTGALSTPLMDRASTPVATLSVHATGPGAYSSDIAVQIVAGSVTNTFTLKVLYQGQVVETYVNLVSPQDAVQRTSSSAWIVVQDLASATVAPNNNPAVVGPVSLAAGADDRANATSTVMVGLLALFQRNLGDGAVAIPGGGDSVHAGLMAHADAYNRIAILSTARGSDKEDLSSLAASIDDKRAGLFAPWVRIDDGFGGTRAIPPDGYIAAVRARAHETVGPWRAAAGDIALSRYVRAVDDVFEKSDSDDLNSSKVNIIIGAPTGVRNYGWRSLANDQVNWGMLTGADVLNRVSWEAESRSEQFVFGVIDPKGHLLAALAGVLEGILAPMADANGLYAWIDDTSGQQIDPGYKVVADATNNNRTTEAANAIYASIGIRVAPSGEMVYLTVTKAGVTARL